MVAMVENKPLQQAPEATRSMIPAPHDTPQAVLMTMQDRYLQVAQNTFINWMGLFTWQIESTECLQQQWEKQVWEQQKAFQRLMSGAMQSYMDFFLMPFSFSQQLVRTAQTTMRQEEELANSFDSVVAALGDSHEA